MINQNKQIDKSFFKICQKNKSGYSNSFLKINNFIVENKMNSIKDFEEWLALNPFFISKSDFDKLNNIFSEFSKFIKVLHKKVGVDEFQNLLNFSNQEKELYEVDINLKTKDPIPLMRFDLVFEKDKPYLVEINTNCPNGYGGSEYVYFCYDNYLNVSQLKNNYKLTEVYPDKMVSKKILENSDKNSNILILNIAQKRDAIFIEEVKYFTEKYLKPKHKNVYFANIDELGFKDKKCYYKNNKIDTVHRIFDLDDLLKHPKKKQFIECYKNKSFKMVNPFISSMFGEKSLLALIYNGCFDKYFKDQKQAKIIKSIITPSYIFKGIGFNKIKNKILNNKNNYVFKKSVSSRAEQIYIGQNINKKEWTDLIKNKVNNRWMVQKKISIDKYKFLSFREGHLKEFEKIADFLPFVIDDKIVGVFSRISNSLITNFARGGAWVNLTYIYDKRKN